MEKFKKGEDALSTALDQWIYAMKHAERMDKVPVFLNAPELDNFFYLARYSNLTKEERDMYRTEEQVGWDNRNTANFAGGKKEGREEGRKEGRQEGLEEGREEAFAEKKAIAKNLKIKGFNLKIIAEATGFPLREIEAF